MKTPFIEEFATEDNYATLRPFELVRQYYQDTEVHSFIVSDGFLYVWHSLTEADRWDIEWNGKIDVMLDNDGAIYSEPDPLSKDVITLEYFLKNICLLNRGNQN